MPTAARIQPELLAAVAARARIPYRRPLPHLPIRFAQIGQSTYFEACSLGDEHEALETCFLEFRAGADVTQLRRRLNAFDPHVVLVFRPEVIPTGALADLDAIAVGFLTEPLPRSGRTVHPDLERRLAEFRAVDAGNFDRLISFDPLMAETAAAIAPVWRSIPLPVADRYYADVRPPRGPARLLFLGRSTPHREHFLLPAKHAYDLLHIAHGVGADQLETLLAEYEVGINLHNEPYPSFENRVCLHLAAGHLVMSESLSPTHGLEPGIDYLEITLPRELMHHAYTLQRFPAAYERVRVRGRMKAEQYRASAIYPRLIHDLYADVAAFGSSRAS